MKTTPLQQLIIERIRESGPITFADYMQMALYKPGYGYYMTGPAKMGWEGDYYTSTDVSPLFAHCVGRQLELMWEELARPTRFVVLEQGAGRGDLAEQIQTWVKHKRSALAQALTYETTDITVGKDAREKLSEQLRDLRPQVVVSNELIDAFPVHVLEKQGERLLEICVTTQGEHLVEVYREIDDETVAGYLDTYKIPWRTFEDGWRAEVNLDALRWMAQTAQLICGPQPRRKRRGFVLTIDYGETARELYTAYRRRGTLASYYHHQLTEQPLTLVGKQDLTAHVNFSALIQAGREQGLRLQTFTTQRQWLIDLGIYEELEQIRKEEFAIVDLARASDAGQVALLQWYNLRQRVTALTARDGMGDFKVLIMKR